MPLTHVPLYCMQCGCQQIKSHKSYTLKVGTIRQLYYCPDCKSYFSETQNTPLAHLKTPISRIILILQSLNEGSGINAVCRVFEVSKNSIYRWQERLSELKSTVMLYALCQQFLHRLIEGDELYQPGDSSLYPTTSLSPLGTVGGQWSNCLRR
jgi:transposase-like protein